MSYADRQWAVGDTITVDVVITDPYTGLGLTGQTPSLWLQRASDGLYWTGAAWGAVTALSPSEVDATNLPGLYRYTGPAATEDRYTARAKVDNVPTVQGEAYEVHVGVAKLSREGADGDTLETLSDQLDTVAVPTGSSMVTITVVDGDGAPVEDVQVSIYDSGNTAFKQTKTTNASGQVITTLNDATYAVRLRKAGYTFTVPETLVVSGVTADQYAGTAYVLPIPTSPNACIMYGDIIIPGGGPSADIEVKARIILPSAIAAGRFDNTVLTTTTDAMGRYSFEIAHLADAEITCADTEFRKRGIVPELESQDVEDWTEI